MSVERSRSCVGALRQKLQRYTSGLLRENKRLREAAVELESHQRRLDSEISAARRILQEQAEMCRVVAAFESTRANLMIELARTRQERSLAERELALLRATYEQADQLN